jgi:hypothetical protein
VFYFFVSFLMKNTHRIKAADIAKLPVVMTTLKIMTSKELEAIFV